MRKMMSGILALLMLAGCNAKESKQQQGDTQPEKKVEIAAEGKVAPDFTLNDNNGMPLTLSSLRGQYVVLDFWGTWCKWCVKGIPDMKTYYDKYNGKFEILSIDFNDSEETWQNAIEDYGMEWLHVITDEDSAPMLLELYAIEGYPTKMIIDPNGRIIHITVGEAPAFYEFLDDLFGKKK